MVFCKLWYQIKRYGKENNKVEGKFLSETAPREIRTSALLFKPAILNQKVSPLNYLHIDNDEASRRPLSVKVPESMID